MVILPFSAILKEYTAISRKLENELVLVFDNTEEILMNFQEFKDFLTKMIQHDKEGRLQLLLTSRVKLDGVTQVSNYLVNTVFLRRHQKKFCCRILDLI